MLNAKLIGNKIAEARKQADISQAQLGQRLFISAQAVGKWERGESLPDIVTLNRLAELLGVDLNYFSERFPTSAGELQPLALAGQQDEVPVSVPAEAPADNKKKKPGWNMSHGSWVDADFTGLHNLHEKFSGANLQRCRLVDADLQGLVLGGNNIESCDLTHANLRDCTFRGSSIGFNVFKGASLVDATITSSDITGCDFSEADLAGTEIRYSSFSKNTVKGATWVGTRFVGSSLYEITFEGRVQDCYFESCSYKKVAFENATLTNTFFNTKNLKRITFKNCQVDRITYEFLKLGKADLAGITLLPVTE